MKGTAELTGVVRWLTAPASYANALMAIFAALYAISTVELPDAAISTAGFVVAVVSGLTFLLSEVLLGRTVRSLRGMVAGRVALSEATRLDAIDEVQALPAQLGRLAALFWVIGLPAVGLGLLAIASAPVAVAVRLALIGGLLAPLAAIGTAVLVARRAHALMERLADGLSPEKVAAAIGSSGAAVRRRLTLFTVALVAVPSVAAIDFTRVWGRRLARTWLEHAGTPELDAVMATARTTMTLEILALIALSLAIAAVVAWAGGGVLTRPLQQLTAEAEAISQGRTTQSRFIAGDGEVGMVASTFSRLKERLHSLVKQLSSASARVVTALRALQLASRGSEAGAAEQAAALNETSATTEELAQSARQIASSASSVQELAQRTLQAAESGLQSAEAFRIAIERMRQDNRSIANAVERLTGRVQQIGRIVDVINTVADRSDLLALSAELEGTRAHDVGRGFSLVALEMRRLAENVLESTAEVEELIAEIRGATRQTAEATERARVLTEGGTELADEVAHSLTSVAQSARQTSDAVRTISLATQQQQTGTDQLAEAMADILAVTQQSLASSRQLGDANERLESLSAGLTEVVARFQGKA